jgi:diguanylate cyclase (GGDEF)-like protein
MHFHDYLRKIPAFWIVVFCLALVVLIGVLDYYTGVELSFDIFLLIPVLLAGWFVNRSAGVGLAVFSAGVWTIANYKARATFFTPFFFDLNVLERLGLFLVIVLLISELRLVFNRVEELSRTDSLTELLNPRAFYGGVASELGRAERFGRPLTVVYLDVDDFKKINDEHGHMAGDDLLRVIASVIKRNIRVIDIAGRLGGDEFSIVLPETGEAQAREVVERLVLEVGEVMAEKGYSTTLSIGAVIVSEFPASVEEIIKRADEAMYVVKKSGKNAVSYEARR